MMRETSRSGDPRREPGAVLSAYADTSFLYSLYVQQVHSLRAAAYMATAGDAPLPLTTLGRFELLNAIRLSVFRQQLDPEAAAADLQIV